MEDLKLHIKNIRKNILTMIANANSGHPGGSLGAADILGVLYFEEMNINEANANSLDRDKFVLSKLHAASLQSWDKIIVFFFVTEHNFLLILSYLSNLIVTT